MQDPHTMRHPSPAVAERSADPNGQADPLLDLVASAPRYEPATVPAASAPPPDADFLTFYGLADNPFADAVNTGYFYRTATHAQAVEHMLLAVRYHVSLGMVVGASGLGKTLISQILLHEIDPAANETILVLVTPGLSRTGLLQEILSELNVGLPMGINRTQDLVRLLGNRVIDLHRQGRRLVILIDECHFLTADSLQTLRTISNIEEPAGKLVTCLLFGEPRFAKRLEHPAYESLRNRMYMRCELHPMSAAECAQYVQFRLLAAHRLEPLFQADALAALYAGSRGICRSLSKLCMLCLIQGARQGSKRIDAGLVAAAAEMGGMAMPDARGDAP